MDSDSRLAAPVIDNLRFVIKINCHYIFKIKVVIGVKVQVFHFISSFSVFQNILIFIVTCHQTIITFTCYIMKKRKEKNREKKRKTKLKQAAHQPEKTYMTNEADTGSKSQLTRTKRLLQ